jgi:hypothetical protein
MLVVFVSPPDVPVMVTETVPVVAVLLAVSVSVLEVAVGFGLNEAVTPFGRPDADKFTLPLKPFCGVTVIVLVPLALWTILTLVGDADRVKFPVAAEVNDTLSKVAVASVGGLLLAQSSLLTARPM